MQKIELRPLTERLLQQGHNTTDTFLIREVSKASRVLS